MPSLGLQSGSGASVTGLNSNRGLRAWEAGTLTRPQSLAPHIALTGLCYTYVTQNMLTQECVKSGPEINGLKQD